MQCCGCCGRPVRTYLTMSPRTDRSSGGRWVQEARMSVSGLDREEGTACGVNQVSSQSPFEDVYGCGLEEACAVQLSACGAVSAPVHGARALGHRPDLQSVERTDSRENLTHAGHSQPLQCQGNGAGEQMAEAGSAR